MGFALENKLRMGLRYMSKVVCLFFVMSFADAEFCHPCKPKEAISTDKTPSAIGPYSQGILAGSYLFVSGQIGMTPEGELVDTTAAGQTHQALQNIGAILEEAGLDFSHVVKSSVLLKDINEYDEVNEVYKDYFPAPAPARAAFQVAALPKNALVEIEVIATVN